MIVSNITLKK